MLCPPKRLANLEEKKKKKASISTKHDSLAIQRPSISRNPRPSKFPHHPHAPRLIESYPSPLHNDVHLPLRLLIQSAPTVSPFDIPCQVEITRM